MSIVRRVSLKTSQLGVSWLVYDESNCCKYLCILSELCCSVLKSLMLSGIQLIVMPCARLALFLNILGWGFVTFYAT